MVKRIMLALTFIAAFSAVGVGVTENADAWRRWGRQYARYYYNAPRDYYYGGAPYYGGTPYGTFYRGYYEPRYYEPYYGGYTTYYSYPGEYYYDPGPGVYVSWGY